MKLNDVDFMNAAGAAVEERTPVHSRILLWILCGFITLFLVWANLSEIDELARGEGKVIPSQQLQVVQNLEGGIVSEILVEEGALVEKGQVLLKIDDTLFASTYKENQFHLYELKAKAARLRAEIKGDSEYKVPQEVADQVPDLVREEEGLFKSRVAEQAAATSVIDQQIRQKQREVEQARFKFKQAGKEKVLAEKELNLLKPLHQQGVVSQVEVIRAEKELVRLTGEEASNKSKISQIEAGIQELKGKRNELGLRYQNEAKADLNDVLAEMSRVSQSTGALEDKVLRTDVRSPVKGTVKQLLVNTIGGVVQPGMDIVSIVPIEDTLLIETRIKPADIARLYPGQHSQVKFTAYDFAIYGGLPAEVVHISADSITEKDGSSFYQVRVKTDKNYLGSPEAPLPIIPGMIAQVDIMTGKKTIMDYLLKPIFKAKQVALTER